MNAPPGPPRPERCPSCGSALNDRALVCGSCGAVISIEIGSLLLRNQASALSRRLLVVLGRRAAVTWGLALFPFLIAPPLIALLMLRRRADSGLRDGDRSLVATVAIVNIILSVMFWHWIGATALGLGSALWSLLKSLGATVAPVARPTLI